MTLECLYAWFYEFISFTVACAIFYFFFFSSRRRHTRCSRDWSSDVCSSDLIDGVYSMSGALPPLADLNEVAKQHNAVLYVDDAHGTGVLGTNGRGTVLDALDRKSTRLNSSHGYISYAVFCLKKKKTPTPSTAPSASSRSPRPAPRRQPGRRCCRRSVPGSSPAARGST